MNEGETPFEEDETRVPQGVPLNHTNLVGNTLGEFEIAREIGRGGMGIVYEGFQKSLNRRVAIKVLPESFSGHKNFVDRFHKEAEVLASLTHPNIIPIFNFGAVGNICYFAMEFVDGTPLSATLAALRRKNEKMSDIEALQIIRRIAEGLSYAHGKGVYHMDVKPGNILIDKEDRILIADFGLVKIGKLGNAEGSQLAGTPMYMSPEQIMGNKTDHRSDIYSLGCVFYELLTGSPPFKEGSLKSLMSKVTTEPPVAPSTIVRDIPILLDSIVLKLLEKEPEKRFQTMAEFLNILDRYQKGMLTISVDKQQSLVKRSLLKPLIICMTALFLTAAGWVVFTLCRYEYYKEWAKTQLTLADNYRANNVDDAAKRIYKDIVKKVPQSNSGKTAKQRLEELEK